MASAAERSRPDSRGSSKRRPRRSGPNSKPSVQRRRRRWASQANQTTSPTTSYPSSHSLGASQPCPRSTTHQSLVNSCAPTQSPPSHHTPPSPALPSTRTHHHFPANPPSQTSAARHHPPAPSPAPQWLQTSVTAPQQTYWRQPNPWGTSTAHNRPRYRTPANLHRTTRTPAARTVLPSPRLLMTLASLLPHAQTRVLVLGAGIPRLAP